MSKWINVEDKIPEKSEHNHWSKSVLGYSEQTKSQYTVTYNYNSNIFELFPSCGFDIVHGSITHWQPLPEPPK